MPQKHPPANTARAVVISSSFDLIYIIAVSLVHHVCQRYKTQRSGINAIAQATAISGTVRKYVPEVTLAIGRVYLCPEYTMAVVMQLFIQAMRDRLGNTWAATTSL